jgi:hypothetical protein
MNLVWLDLDSICKIYEANKKNRNGKEEEKEKYKMDLREPFGPVPEKAHGPPELTETVPSFFPFSR